MLLLPQTVATRMIACLASTHKLWLKLSIIHLHLNLFVLIKDSYRAAIVVICPDGIFICVTSKQNYIPDECFWRSIFHHHESIPPRPRMARHHQEYYIFCRESQTLTQPSLSTITGWGGRPKFVIYLLIFGGFRCSNPNMRITIFVLFYIISIRRPAIVTVKGERTAGNHPIENPNTTRKWWIQNG